MFTTEFPAFACEHDHICCNVDGLRAVARIERDDCTDRPDQRDDGFWPSTDESAAGYIGPDGDFAEQQAHAERIMTAWEKDEWFYAGVCVTIEKAGVQLTGRYDHALWGVECNYPDSDNSYLRQVANELLDEALEAAKAKLRDLCA